MNFAQSVIGTLKKSFTFSGRASKTEIFYFNLFFSMLVLLFFLTILYQEAFNIKKFSSLDIVFLFLLTVSLLMPAIVSLNKRRKSTLRLAFAIELNRLAQNSDNTNTIKYNITHFLGRILFVNIKTITIFFVSLILMPRYDTLKLWYNENTNLMIYSFLTTLTVFYVIFFNHYPMNTLKNRERLTKQYNSFHNLLFEAVLPPNTSGGNLSSRYLSQSLLKPELNKWVIYFNLVKFALLILAMTISVLKFC